MFVKRLGFGHKSTVKDIWRHKIPHMKRHLRMMDKKTHLEDIEAEILNQFNAIIRGNAHSSK